MVYLHQENIYLSEAWHMENRILIIEDDVAIAQTLKLNLECAGYAVTSFDNGLTRWSRNTTMIWRCWT